MIQNSVVGIGVRVFCLDAVFDAIAPPITVAKQLATPTAFSCLKGVNRDGFNASDSTKTVHNKYGFNN